MKYQYSSEGHCHYTIEIVISRDLLHVRSELSLQIRCFSFGLFFFFSAGLIIVLPCTDVFTRVDLRTVTSNIPLQEVTTYAIAI